MARDSERKKTYLAEYDYAITHGYPEIHAFQIQAKINDIIRSRWWKARSSVRAIPVEPAKKPYAKSDEYAALRHSYRNGAIWVPLERYRFSLLDLMHELAHIMRPGRYLHDGDFRHDELELISRWAGNGHAKGLRAMFEKHGLEQ